MHLYELPPELVAHVCSFLPSLECLFALSCTHPLLVWCRRDAHIIAAIEEFAAHLQLNEIAPTLQCRKPVGLCLVDWNAIKAAHIVGVGNDQLVHIVLLDNEWALLATKGTYTKWRIDEIRKVYSTFNFFRVKYDKKENDVVVRSAQCLEVASTYDDSAKLISHTTMGDPEASVLLREFFLQFGYAAFQTV